MIVPDGWGWRDLDISGPNLVSWRSTDSEHFSVHLCNHNEADDEEGPDDSFSTIRNLRPQPRTALGPRTHTSASLMKQTLPVAGDLNVDDFSFEMTSGDNLTIPASTGSGGSRPGTPGRFSPSLNSPATSTRGPSHLQNPVEARCFDLVFGSGAEEDRSFAIEGTLIPLSPLTLVSASTPMRIPFVRVRPQFMCFVQCPNATYASGDKDEGTCDTSGETIGAFAWTDASGFPIRPAHVEPIDGHIRVRILRDQWGARSMSIIFPWPGKSSEVVFPFAGDRPLRVAKAEIEGIAIPRCLTQTGEGGQEVRLGRGTVVKSTGRIAEVTLEFSGTDGSILFPRFGDAQGELTVELRGEGWDSKFAQPRSGETSIDQTAIARSIQAPFVRSNSYLHTFHAKLPTTAPLFPQISNIAPASKRSRARTLFSLNTFLYLFILWLVISLGQQVQRLRTELAYVAEEARDLRMYGYDQRPVPDPVKEECSRTGDLVPTIYPDGTDWKPEPGRTKAGQSTEVAVEGERERSLGRVVFGRSGWDRWMNHPT